MKQTLVIAGRLVLSDPNSRDFQTLFPEPEHRSTDDDPRSTGQMLPPVFPKTRVDTPKSQPVLDDVSVGEKTSNEAPETVGANPPSTPSSEIVTAASPPPQHVEPGKSSSNAPTQNEPSSSLHAQLVGLQLITPQQWREASERAKGTEDVHRILNELKNISSHRTTRNGDEIPALTNFQVEQILAGNADRLRLQHYVVLERLGAGGMGEVFKAWNLNLERLEAIKTIIQVDTGDGTGSSTQGLARFEQEARVLAQLDHDCITTIYHAGREHGLAFIAMEYVSGDNMKAIVDSAFAEADPVPVWWAVERGIAIAEALEHAHSKGVIHRDVKPSNVMITEKGELKVLDMGIARLVRPRGGTGQTSRLTQNQTGLGTPEVMPPEQWADATAVTAESDIYSLGCTLFYMLTGRMPFEATSIQGFMFSHINDLPPKPSSLRKEIPTGLDKVIFKMLAKEPENRYPNCGEVVKALLPFSEADRLHKGDSGGLFSSRSLLAAVSGFSLVVILVGMIVVGMQFLPEPEPVGPDTPEQITQAPPDTVIEKKDLTEKNATETPVKPVVDTRGDLKDWLAKYQTQHTTVWPKLADLNAFANLKDSVISPQTRDEIKKSIEKETASRWRKHVDDKLQSYVDGHPQAWGDLGKLQAFANPLFPLDKIQDEQELEKLLDEIDHKTWDLEFEQWIADFQMTHSEFWDDPESLKSYAIKNVPGKYTDKSRLQEIQSVVLQETRNLITNKREEWLSDFQKDNSETWTDLDALREEADKRSDVNNIVDNASYRRFQQNVTLLTERLKNPFQGIDTSAIKDEGELYRVKSLLETYEWLLSLPEENRDPDWDFEVRIDVEGKLITDGEKFRGQVGDGIGIEINPKQSGYATCFFKTSTNSHYLVRTAKAILNLEAAKHVPEKWEEVTRARPDTLGRDHLAIYYTDVDPFEIALTPIPASVRKMEGPGLWQFSRFGIERSDEAENLAAFKMLFKDPFVFQRVEEYLLTGKRYPTLKPAQNVKHWNMKSFEIEVVNP